MLDSLMDKPELIASVAMAAIPAVAALIAAVVDTRRRRHSEERDNLVRKFEPIRADRFAGPIRLLLANPERALDQERAVRTQWGDYVFLLQEATDLSCHKRLWRDALGTKHHAEACAFMSHARGLLQAAADYPGVAEKLDLVCHDGQTPSFDRVYRALGLPPNASPARTRRSEAVVRVKSIPPPPAPAGYRRNRQTARSARESRSP